MKVKRHIIDNIIIDENNNFWKVSHFVWKELMNDIECGKYNIENNILYYKDFEIQISFLNPITKISDEEKVNYLKYIL